MVTTLLLSLLTNESDYYIQHGEKEKSVRKIFDCVPYTPFEQEKLKEFEEMIVKEKLQLPPGFNLHFISVNNE